MRFLCFADGSRAGLFILGFVLRSSVFLFRVENWRQLGRGLFFNVFSVGTFFISLIGPLDDFLSDFMYALMYSFRNGLDIGVAFSVRGLLISNSRSGVDLARFKLRTTSGLRCGNYVSVILYSSSNPLSSFVIKMVSRLRTIANHHPWTMKFKTCALDRTNGLSSLAGLSMFITGGNRGIGLATAM